jgi:hypothetical protein
MKIKENDATTYFGDIKDGEVFFADGYYFIKMNDSYYIDGGHEIINTVALQSGAPSYFDTENKVIVKEDAELVIH